MKVPRCVLQIKDSSKADWLVPNPLEVPQVIAAFPLDFVLANLPNESNLHQTTSPFFAFLDLRNGCSVVCQRNRFVYRIPSILCKLIFPPHEDIIYSQQDSNMIWDQTILNNTKHEYIKNVCFIFKHSLCVSLRENLADVEVCYLR